MTVLSPKILDDKQNYIFLQVFCTVLQITLASIETHFRGDIKHRSICVLLIKKLKINKILKISLFIPPSIFLVFFVILHRIFYKNNNNRYFLILRDLFPIWAYNTGLIKYGIVYRVLKFISSLQFKFFDVIGVQDSAAIDTIKKYYNVTSKIIVLPNWVSEPELRQDQTELDDSLKRKSS